MTQRLGTGTRLQTMYHPGLSEVTAIMNGDRQPRYARQAFTTHGRIKLTEQQREIVEEDYARVLRRRAILDAFPESNTTGVRIYEARKAHPDLFNMKFEEMLAEYENQEIRPFTGGIVTTRYLTVVGLGRVSTIDNLVPAETGLDWAYAPFVGPVVTSDPSVYEVTLKLPHILVDGQWNPLKEF